MHAHSLAHFFISLPARKARQHTSNTLVIDAAKQFDLIGDKKPYHSVDVSLCHGLQVKKYLMLKLN